MSDALITTKEVFQTIEKNVGITRRDELAEYYRLRKNRLSGVRIVIETKQLKEIYNCISLEQYRTEALFLDWFPQNFITEVKKYMLQVKNCLSKILLMLDKPSKQKR